MRDRLCISLFVLSALAALPACGSKKGPPADWIARVAALSGTVSLIPKRSESSKKASKNDYLRVGGTLITGPDGAATLVLRNGGRLQVKPNTTLRLRSDKPTSEVSLKLLGGSVESTAPQVAASELVINVGGRRVRLGRAARATISMPEGSVKRAAVLVSFGTASVQKASGQTEKVIAGQTLALSLTAPPAKRLDAGVPADAAMTASPLTFFLLNKGRGKVLVLQPGDRRFRRVRRRKTIPVRVGTELKLLRGAQVLVGPEKGKGVALRGPAQVVLREGPPSTPGGLPTVRVESKAGDLAIRDRGRPGKRGSKLSVEGVSIATRVVWRALDVKVRRERGKATVIVGNGEALLTDAKGKVTRLEAGQRATIKSGTVGSPTQASPVRLAIERPGAMRAFTASRRVPVTLRWDRGLGDALVEVSRSPRFSRPLFADVLKRRELTLPGVPRGTVYWRVRPVQGGKPGAGQKGRLTLLVDTSYRVLRGTSPKNTIDQRDGDVRVYYQNALPRFTFRWRRVGGASRYELKLFREGNLTRPLVRKGTRRTSLKLRRSLSEGRYLWYVSARGRRGSLLKGMKSRRLTIRYDNATPNLQIIYPRNGLKVAKASIEVRGITIRGSRVFVNGQAASLDDAYRFRHTVALKPGDNKIVFRVEDKRRGSSLYLRHVLRR